MKGKQKVNRREFFNLIPIPFLSKLIPDKNSIEKYLKEMYLIHKKNLMQPPYPKVIWIKKINDVSFSEISENSECFNIQTNLNNGTINGSFTSKTEKTNKKILENLEKQFELIIDYHGEKTKARCSKCPYIWSKFIPLNFNLKT